MSVPTRAGRVVARLPPSASAGDVVAALLQTEPELGTFLLQVGRGSSQGESLRRLYAYASIQSSRGRLLARACSNGSSALQAPSGARSYGGVSPQPIAPRSSVTAGAVDQHDASSPNAPGNWTSSRMLFTGSFAAAAAPATAPLASADQPEATIRDSGFGSSSGSSSIGSWPAIPIPSLNPSSRSSSSTAIAPEPVPAEPPAWEQLQGLARKRRTDNKSELQLGLQGALSASALAELVGSAHESMSPGELLTALHRAARLKPAPPLSRRQSPTEEQQQWDELMTKLTTRFVQLSPNLSNAEMVLGLAVFSRMQLLPGPPQVVRELLARLHGRVKDMEGNHVADLLWSLTRLKLEDPQLLSELVSQGRDRALEMSGGAVKKMLWSLAKQGKYDWQLLLQLSNAGRQRAAEMHPGNLAACAWSLAALHHYDDPFLEALEVSAVGQMSGFSPPHLSQMAGAFARLKYEANSFYPVAAERVVVLAHQLSPGHVANISWALAKRGQGHEAAFNALAARTVQLQGQLEPQHYSMVAWSFAKVGHKLPAFFTTLGDAAAAAVPGMAPQNMANIAWAYGQLGCPHPALFGAIAAAVQQPGVLERFGSQNISDLAWGASTVGYQDPGLFTALAAATSADISSFSPHSLSDVAWAFANLQQQSPAPPACCRPLMEVVAAEAAGRVETMGLGMITDLLWACGAVGVANPQLLEGAARLLSVPSVLDKLRSDLEAQAKVLWCFKQLGYRNSELEAVLVEVIPELPAILGNDEGAGAA